MTANELRSLKGQRRISALTAYDYPTARLLDEAGVDVLLVGDSLGMVVLGFPDTTRVTMEHMLHHTEAVARGAKNALIIGDLPIHSYDNSALALRNASKLIDAGAHAVKLEGGIRQAEKVERIVRAGIPVIGHMGMLPQRVLEEGGYKKKGKTEAEAVAIREGVDALCKAGISALVLESVVPEVAESITSQCPVPTIGIGCGDDSCDGEVAVVTDLIGSYPWFVPPFAKPEAAVANEITRAAENYVARVSKA